MVVRATAVLGATTTRLAAVALVGVVLGVYDAVADQLPDVSYAADVALVAGLLIPATFALPGLALPARPWRHLLAATLALAALAVLLETVDLRIAANYVKLAAVVGAGWVFLRFFETVSWVVLVALLIIPVDAFSVARGPTKHIIANEPQVFDRLSISFPIPGEGTAAQLGLPDVLFFALFLGAADRFGLRPGLTWLACTLSFSATLVITAYTDVSGLPALPLLSAAFVLVNADLIWKRLRASRRP